MQEQKMQVLQGTVRTLLRRGANANLTQVFAKIHPADIAHLLRYFPVFTGMGGDVGGQTSTIIVRGFASGGITATLFIQHLL